MGIEPSVRRVGDSYDNALAEKIFGLFKAEVISGPMVRGEASRKSSSPRPNGSIGSTTDDFSNPSETFLQQNSKR